MSINSAMLAGVSGLIANSSALAAISDNIANVNTTAYKRNRTDFSSLVRGDLQAASFNAGGVRAHDRQMVRQQGLLTAASNSTDLGIAGDGFFMVRNAAARTGDAGDNLMFTRVGSFSPDESGNLRNQFGYFLQGWRLNANGELDGSPGLITPLETVNLASIAGAASPTTRVEINANLRASQPANAAAATYTPGQMAAYAVDPLATGAVRPDVTWSFQSYDSLGGLRTFQVSLIKTDTANQWAAEIHAVPADVITGGTDGLVASGILAFTPDGRIDPADTTLPTTLSFNGFDGTAPATGPAPTVGWAADTGVAPQVITLDFGAQAGANGGITQFDSPSVLASATSDGAVFGDLTGVEVDRNGFVTALFNNGTTRRIYQIPLATVVNPDGLTSEAGGAYSVSRESGSYSVKVPGFGGAAQLAARALESSNVDLATEFTGLITTQRAYSAASRIITTSDEMLDELIRMKR